MPKKPVIWLGSSLSEVRSFPDIARQRLGHALDLVQDGDDPPDWKPMPSVGAGVREIRVRTGQQFRLLYVAHFVEGIYVLHAFEKKSQKTPVPIIALARKRLAEIGR